MFAVASLVFLTSTAAKGTIDVSVSVVLGDDLVLSRRGRGGCLQTFEWRWGTDLCLS
jgi:hypothetical protein